jgi:serine/threonine-protein kinase HipA
MKRTIGVFIGAAAQEVGTLRVDIQGNRQSAGFEYHPRWLSSADSFAIEPSLPLLPGMQFHKQARGGSLFHGAIADTEPDGWARRVILRDHAKRRHDERSEGLAENEAPLNPVDFLLAIDDANRVGALRFKDENGVFQRSTQRGRRTAPPLVELRALLAATHAVETNTDTAKDLAYLRGRGTSLGGLRPKCSVLDDNGRLSIGKFPSISDDRAVTKGEVLAMRLAKDAGIDAAAARLVSSEGSPVALIERFDRRDDGRRIPYLSAATMLGVETGDADEHTYTEIIDALRQYGADAQSDIEELWRRVAFFILINNVDDHLHNHGFLHAARGQWRLAPAFDINPFPDRARELKTWISEQSGPEASIEALMSICAYSRIDISKAKSILKDVNQAVARWRERGREIGMTDIELDQFTDAFEHQETTRARRSAE